MESNRHRRDAAGVGPYAREPERLAPLSSLGNWRVAKGEPDIRGWEVKTVSGRQLGAVRDLLVDREAGEVVMVDIDVPGSGRHSLVAIRVVQIDRAARVVLMDSADLAAEDAVALEASDSARPATGAGEVLVDRPPVVDRPAVADEARAESPEAIERPQ